MKIALSLLLVVVTSATQCDLNNTTDMCNSCLDRRRCKEMFGLEGVSDCGTLGHEQFNRSYHVLTTLCDENVQLAGTVDCEVLGMVAEGVMTQCGPACNFAEYVKVNANENSLYCACEGACLKEFTDNTLNTLVGIIVVLLFLQLSFNTISMVDETYNFGLFGKKYVIPVVGKLS